MEALAAALPLGLNATWVTAPKLGSGAAGSSLGARPLSTPDSASSTLANPSAPPTTVHRPFGSNARQLGEVTSSSTSSSAGHTCVPPSASNIRVVSSAAQHNTREPSGLNATANTALSGVNRPNSAPVASSSTRADPANL